MEQKEVLKCWACRDEILEEKFYTYDLEEEYDQLKIPERYYHFHRGKTRDCIKEGGGVRAVREGILGFYNLPFEFFKNLGND